jgi:hypothetical protein
MKTTVAREAARQAHVKGTALLSTLDFVEHKFGAGAKARLLAALPPSRSATFRELILPIQWYDVKVFAELLDTLDRQLGSGDGSLIVERGTWAAEQALNSTLRLLLKLLSPQWLLEKGGRIWNNYQDTGTWEMKRLDHGALATLHQIGIVEPAICANTRGWIIGLLKMSGCKQVSVVEKECRARGGAADVFEIHWT